jgi:hypothetical protein
MGALTLHKTMSSRGLQHNLSNREHLVGRNEQVSRNSCALVLSLSAGHDRYV